MIILIEKEKFDKAVMLSDFNIKKLCEKAGITTQMLWYYRKGKYFPNVLIAVRLCKLLNVKVEDIWHD